MIVSASHGLQPLQPEKDRPQAAQTNTENAAQAAQAPTSLQTSDSSLRQLGADVYAGTSNSLKGALTQPLGFGTVKGALFGAAMGGAMGASGP